MRGFLNILLSGAPQLLKGWVTLFYRVNIKSLLLGKKTMIDLQPKRKRMAKSIRMKQKPSNNGPKALQRQCKKAAESLSAFLAASRRLILPEARL